MLIFTALCIQMMRQQDSVLSQRAGFIGAEHIHRAKVLNGVELFDDHFTPGQRNGAFGQISADNHRQHFRGQPDRDRQSKQRGIHPVPFGEAVNQQHHRNHHQHKADQQLADAVHPTVKRSLWTTSGQR